MLKQARVYIKGDVIGIGFRAWTKIQAKINNINGWVKNEYHREDIFGKNGGVEAVLQGEEEKVNQMIVVVKKGPPVSRVDDVDIIWENVKDIFNEFELRK